MVYKWIGAAFIIISCGGFGISLAAANRREVQMLHQLAQGLQTMRSELKYRLTPLPELCRKTATDMDGAPARILHELAEELERQLAPDVHSCMSALVRRNRRILPGSVRKLLLRLGRSLGRFDLQGQLRGLELIVSGCDEELAILKQNQDIRLRNYRTLGLCAGLALAILFL